MRSWTDDQLIDAVKNSFTKAETLRKLGLTVAGHYKMLDFHIQRLQIDISHFVKNKKSGIQDHRYKTFEELAKENSPHYYSRLIKQRIMKNELLPMKCSECGISNVWNNKSLTLQLDHINGCNTDNRIENLRFLCPNCHSQTDTFSTRKSKNNKQQNHCIKCGDICYKSSVRCKKCKIAAPRKTKIVWPTIEYLIEEIKKIGYVSLAKNLDVSDNAIRKHLKSKNVDLLSLKIKS